jgi:acyl dehydratase
MDVPRAWTVIAVNLPEHAGNAIHTDDGARAAGFPGALVAGVTTYAYLTHSCVVAWGKDWLERGGGELRLRAPVFAGDRVDITPRRDGQSAGGDTVIDAVVADAERPVRATLRAVRDAGPPVAARPGDPLPSRTIELGDYYGADYGWRAGDDLTMYLDEGIVHPAIWPAIANNVYTAELVRGSWVHTRSTIRHHAIARVGESVDVHAVVIDRFERGGQRAVTDIVIERAGHPIVTIEHEAIVELTG